MRRSVLQILMAGAVAGILAISGAAAFAKTVKECDTEYAANKAAIKASGQTKKDYVAACRAGTAPRQLRRLPHACRCACDAAGACGSSRRPLLRCAPRATSKPAAVAPKANVGATGAGGFAADAQARAKCPSDTVVWVNTKSGVYHFAGDAQLRHDEAGDVYVRSGREGGGGPRG